MRVSVLLILGLSFLFSNQVGATENCFLRSYANSIKDSTPLLVPVREVSFEVPVRDNFGGTTDVEVTRILADRNASPHLKDLFSFMEKNNIVLTKGNVPELAGQNSIYIGVAGEALSNEQNLVDKIERSLADYFAVPLNGNKLPAQSRKLVDQMRAKFKTNFIAEDSEQGKSYIYNNTVGIKTRHIENLRVNQVVSHEITHNTTDRKVLEAFNPKLASTSGEGTRISQPFTTTLAGREMSFKGKSGLSLNLPTPVKEYNKYYRSDEIEAHIRELAQAKSDGLDLERTLSEAKGFIDAQEIQLNALLKSKPENLSVITEEVEENLLAGRKQRRTVTSPDVNFNLYVLVPTGISRSEELAFVESTLRKRLETLESYRRAIKKKFPTAI
jgi:hypothetical protein